MNNAYKAVLVLPALYGLSVATGIFYSMTGFIQSDTCWLVKLGLLMLQSHSILQADPFSFTLPLSAQNGVAQPFVLYQWLSEVFLAEVFRLFNLPGLLSISAIVTAISTVALLFRVCLRKSGHLLFSALLCALAAATVALRLMVRPEMFSVLLIVVWLHLWDHFKNQNRSGLNVPSLALFMVTMVFWCNLHTGFVVGLIFLMIQSIVYLASAAFQQQAFLPLARNTAIALLASTLSTLANPAGLSLWTYLPRLFFSPMNSGISETQAMSARELTLPIYYPFFALVVLSTYFAAKAIKRKTELTSAVRQFLRADRAASIATIVVAVLCALCCKRLASPMALFLAYETASLLSGISELPNELMFLQRRVSVLMLEIPVAAFATVAVLLSCDKIAPLTMPQVSMKFSPPFRAAQFLIEHWSGGNIFNNAQIGSMLDMYGKPGMKVFIDTRLDAFGDKIITDYVDMIDVRSRAKSLFDFYDIKWAIVTPQDRVSEVLKIAPGWSKVFEDQDGLVFKRAP